MNLDELKQSKRILFECRAGSFAYGTNTENSDIDIKGIFHQSQEELISFNTPDLQISDDTNDTVYYSLRRYIELASAANPNILELLFIPQDCVGKTSPTFETLKSFRDEFITKKCLETHQAYALAQIKKAKGRNKWINNPQPKDKPTLENFAYFIPFLQNGKTPARPIKFKNSQLHKEGLKASSVEHCPGLYRVYESDAKNIIFTDEQICCSSISIEDENKSFKGLLFINEDAYKRALTDHKNYWEWISKRNPNRWRLQELGELNYDSKNMQHTIRLLLCARGIAKNGLLQVRFEGAELELLRKIRTGAYSYQELISISEDINEEISKLAKSNSLNPEISSERSSEIFLELMKLK